MSEAKKLKANYYALDDRTAQMELLADNLDKIPSLPDDLLFEELDSVTNALDDTYDEGIHLNIYGAEKLSVFFGKYLKEHYELTDYRTVPDVAKDYEKDIEFYNFMRDDQLRELKEYGELMSYGANAIEN